MSVQHPYPAAVYTWAMPPAHSDGRNWGARTVEEPPANPCHSKSWANTAAHIGAYAAECLADALFCLIVAHITTVSIIVFLPSAFVAIPGAICLALLFSKGTNYLFGYAHTAIDNRFR